MRWSAEWPRWRPEVIRQTGTPSDGPTRLAEREAELAGAMAEVERLLARKDSHVRVEKDAIVLSPLEADPRPASAEALAARITERPAATLPMMATMATFSCAASAAPVSRPPGTTLNTPAGRSPSISSAKRSADNGA